MAASCYVTTKQRLNRDGLRLGAVRGTSQLLWRLRGLEIRPASPRRESSRPDERAHLCASSPPLEPLMNATCVVLIVAAGQPEASAQAPSTKQIAQSTGERAIKSKAEGEEEAGAKPDA